MDTRDKGSDTVSSAVQPPEPGTMPPTLDLLDPSSAPVAVAELKEKSSRQVSTPFQDSMRRLTRDKRAMASIIVLLLMVFIALLGPLIYQQIGGIYPSDFNGNIGPQLYHQFSHQELSRLDEGPSAQYWLGTDNLGRDLLARGMQGLTISIIVAIGVEIIDVVFGIVIGVLAGFYGGWIDQILARFTDLIFAFPNLLFIILLAGIFGPSADTWFGSIPFIKSSGSARLVIGSAALALTVWPLMARFVRGQTLQLKEQQFIEAARTAGTSDLRIIVRHIIPNLVSLVFVASTLNLANTIIGEAGISLLGLGVESPGSSLGLMISDALAGIDAHPWEVLFPTIILTVIVIAISFLGDGLRDAFDPRSKD